MTPPKLLPLKRELYGRNFVVYDTEIARAIGKQADGSEIGWGDFDRMGLSVACLFDYRDGDYKVYFESDARALADRLNSSELVIAFNHKQFDNHLVKHHAPHLKVDLPNYDMLWEARLAVGMDPDKPSHGGLKLDKCLEGTFGKSLMKTGHGALAPVMWQEGKIAEVVSYCLADVRRERLLFEECWMHGKFRSSGMPGRDIVVRHPLEILKLHEPLGQVVQK